MHRLLTATLRGVPKFFPDGSARQELPFRSNEAIVSRLNAGGNEGMQQYRDESTLDESRPKAPSVCMEQTVLHNPL
jgi:hypothetical protein